MITEKDSIEAQEINEEFFHIFGTPRHSKPIMEEYEDIRQYVLNAPTMWHDKRHLPFEGVKLASYGEIELDKIISMWRYLNLFYIKRNSYIDSNYCYAVGFFNLNSRHFTILRRSMIVQSDSFTIFEEELKKRRKAYIRNWTEKRDAHLCLIEDISAIDAEFAACMVLGRKAEMGEWKNEQGRTIMECYPEAFKPEPKQKVVPYISSPKKTNSTPRLFYIKKGTTAGRICDAMGSYSRRTNEFVLKEGSLLALTPTSSYNETPQGHHRRMFVSMYCSEVSYGYILRHDVTCKSPSIAASYVIGSQVNGWDYWKDESGKTLSELYRLDSSV